MADTKILRIYFELNDKTSYLDVPSEIEPQSDNYAAWKAIEEYDRKHKTRWMSTINRISKVTVLDKDGKETE